MRKLDGPAMRSLGAPTSEYAEGGYSNCCAPAFESRQEERDDEEEVSRQKEFEEGWNEEYETIVLDEQERQPNTVDTLGDAAEAQPQQTQPMPTLFHCAMDGRSLNEITRFSRVSLFWSADGK